MIKFTHILLLALAALVTCTFTSCEHRELVDGYNMHYIRVYLDEQIKNVTCGIYNEAYEPPTYTRAVNFRAVLASPSTGKIEAEAILRNHSRDESGEYIDGYIGGKGGEYNLMVYSLGSPITLIKNANNFFELEAYTPRISDRMMAYLPIMADSLGKENILDEPEHMLACSYEGIKIPLSTRLDTLTDSKKDYFKAQSIVNSYYIQLKLKGVEWVSAVGAVLSGVAGSVKMGNKEALAEASPAHLFFTMSHAEKFRRSGDEVSTATLYATFNTFGKVADDNSKLYFNIEFTKTDGKTQVETIDITEIFKTPMVRDKQWILLENEIVIDRPEGVGSMGPGVEGWEDVNAEIPM